MAFVRVQGSKILILHNRREGRKVRQEKLHVFEDTADAADCVDSDERWRRLCDSLALRLPRKSSLKQAVLRRKLQEILTQLPASKTEDPLQQAAGELIASLLSLNEPLTPSQLRALASSRDALQELSDTIHQKLELLARAKEAQMSITVETAGKVTEEIFDEGLNHYDRGEWNQAKDCFVRGLNIDPDHVDLLVHAGLSELLDKNLHLALGYFDHGVEIGRLKADLEIRSNPDEDFIKADDRAGHFKGWVCRLSEECLDWGTDRCDSCEENPEIGSPSLYSYHRFRPFFRAMTNKAITLMRLKRYGDAINTLTLCRSYDDLWGTSNMIGECYFALGETEEAALWYREMLWAEAFYVRALILFVLHQREEALRHLLTGLCHNWHIGRMLSGQEKPEQVRYIGPALPERLSASEFMHERQQLFRKHNAFKVMIRCCLQDDEIGPLVLDLEESWRRRKEERDFDVPREHWDLITGNMREEFLARHVPRLLGKITEKDSDWWLPQEHELIAAEVVEKKTTNWLVRLVGTQDRIIYLRPCEHTLDVAEGDTIKIEIVKGWYYKKRLFVSGEIV